MADTVLTSSVTTVTESLHCRSRNTNIVGFGLIIGQVGWLNDTAGRRLGATEETASIATAVSEHFVTKPSRNT